VRVTGTTVHFVDEQYDHGPIILQEAVPVLDDDTPEALAARVQAAERRLVPEAVRLFAAGRLRIEGRRVRILPP
jgi:phosphoribosylglycinamide formyltransferase-1